MKANFRTSLEAVLVHEGGYSNHPKDPGGATMKGVTQRVYNAYRQNKGQSIQTVKNISQTELEDIYYQQYWMACKADNLPSGLDYAVFDYAVNSGPSRAIKHLQEILGVKQDGLMGNVTISAAYSKATVGIINDLCERRMRFLKGLPTWDTFDEGWTRRVNGVLSKANKMAEAVVLNPMPQVPLPKPPAEPISTGRSIGEVMLFIVVSIIMGIIAIFVGGK